MNSQHSPEDQKWIDSLPKGIVTAFRSSIYLPTYIASNAHLFIDDDWINVVQIRDFLQGAAGPAPDLAPGPPDTPLTRVKVEHDASTTRLSATADVKTRILKEGGQEVVEILDSDTDSDCEIGGDNAKSSPSSSDMCSSATDTRKSSPLPPSDIPSEVSYAITDLDDDSSSDESGLTRFSKEPQTRTVLNSTFNTFLLSFLLFI
ncbi:hypothetical protein B0H17DRAFT_1325102 [Mycena rosella]|uniref:Uncharacterized protein n=1 Tax=Mycena rosella TaxID=1033263 RepID=A0AAD7MAH6_MYCRO|nr:hypothetical protein B0H17DRAFT_1325102 [Mycena rosella]